LDIATPEMLKLKLHEKLEVGEGIYVVRVLDGFVYLFVEGKYGKSLALTSQYIHYDHELLEAGKALLDRLKTISSHRIPEAPNSNVDISDFLKKLK
jgi:hypothetical protein